MIPASSAFNYMFKDFIEFYKDVKVGFYTFDPYMEDVKEAILSRLESYKTGSIACYLKNNGDYKVRYTKVYSKNRLGKDLDYLLVPIGISKPRPNEGHSLKYCMSLYIYPDCILKGSHVEIYRRNYNS